MRRRGDSRDGRASGHARAYCDLDVLRIREGFPTKAAGDAESTVRIPLDTLSTNSYKGVIRDTRRRIRGENVERIQHKNPFAAQTAQLGPAYDSMAEEA